MYPEKSGNCNCFESKGSQSAKVCRYMRRIEYQGLELLQWCSCSVCHTAGAEKCICNSVTSNETWPMAWSDPSRFIYARHMTRSILNCFPRRNRQLAWLPSACATGFCKGLTTSTLSPESTQEEAPLERGPGPAGHAVSTTTRSESFYLQLAPPSGRCKISSKDVCRSTRCLGTAKYPPKGCVC